MNKINIIGTSASGKTTFSRKLAKQLNFACIELDDLLWLDDWQETPDPEFFQKIRNKISEADSDTNKQGYVIDGNYSRTTHITWQEIDTVIWLDFPFYLNLYQSIQRALSRAISKKTLWKNSNNTETFSRMLSPDSIILWMIKTHQKNRKKYLVKMHDPKYSHIQFIRLKSRKDCNRFLESL